MRFILILLFLSACTIAWDDPATCYSCHGDCQSNIVCGAGCACAIETDQPWGRCVSTQESDVGQ